MDKDLTKAIALAALFVFVFAFFGSQFAGGGDYSFHLEKARNDCTNLGETCEIYAPLFSWIASPFAFHDNSFFFFVVFLLAFVVPMILYLLTERWIVVWLYFSTSSFFWFFIDGIFAQATAFILLLLVLYFKDWRLQALMVLIAITAHGHGFYLVLVAFLFKNLLELGDKDLKTFLFPCSGLFGVTKPVVLTQQIDGLVTTGKAFTVADALIPFTKIFPFPYMFLAIRQAWKDKKYIYLVLVVVALVSGFWISHRIFYLIPLVLLPSLAEWAVKLKEKNVNHYYLFLLSTLLVFGFQFYSWFQFKLVCST